MMSCDPNVAEIVGNKIYLFHLWLLYVSCYFNFK